jgi:hypothetical protein
MPMHPCRECGAAFSPTHRLAIWSPGISFSQHAAILCAECYASFRGPEGVGAIPKTYGESLGVEEIARNRRKYGR